MALRLYSRCEGATLDGTHDYSAGDTTWTLVSAATFSTSGVKIGTNGLYCGTSDDYAELSSSSIVDRTVGTVAFWVRFDAWAAGEWLFTLQGTAAADRIGIESTGTGELLLRHRVNGGNNVTLLTTAAGLTTGNWYFVQAHWSAAQDDLRLEVYDSTGTLIQAVENLSASLGGSPADIIAIRAGMQQGTSLRASFDNIFIGNAYDDDFLASRDITSYTSYGGGGSAPTITDAGDETYTNGETGIVITGTDFGASQGSGTVKISPTDDVNDANAVTQTVAAWGDTSVTFTCVKGSLAFNTNLYLFVTKDGGYSNASGHVVQIAGTRKLKVFTHSSAAGATGVDIAVYAAPTTEPIHGALIGQATGQAFEASLESGQAVLKVPVAAFGGGALTTSDTPRVLARNGTYTTGNIPATVIEE